MKIILAALIILLVLMAAWAGFVTYFCEDDWCFIFPWQKTREIAEIPYSDEINVAYPLPNAFIESPLIVRGKARGTWYFEASFPVRLLDANGKEIAVIPAQAKSDWMTIEFVPFEAVLSFSAPTTKTGILVLQNDNPSGLAENAKEIRIPVRFGNK